GEGGRGSRSCGCGRVAPTPAPAAARLTHRCGSGAAAAATISTAAAATFRSVVALFTESALAVGANSRGHTAHVQPAGRRRGSAPHVHRSTLAAQAGVAGRSGHLAAAAAGSTFAAAAAGSAAAIAVAAGTFTVGPGRGGGADRRSTAPARFPTLGATATATGDEQHVGGRRRR